MIASSGTKTSAPEVGPFWNGTPIGSWRAPISMPGRSRGISAQVMPQVGLPAEQAIGVAQTEREPDQRRDRRERDVALAPVQADPQHFLAAPLVAAHDALALRRGGVAARLGPGQRKARDLFAAREARQVVVALRSVP